MKKLVIPFMIVAIVVGLYEQTKTKPNIYVLIITIVVFMYGMMQLSAKTLYNKNAGEEIEEDQQNREEDANEG